VRPQLYAKLTNFFPSAAVFAGLCVLTGLIRMNMDPSFLPVLVNALNHIPWRTSLRWAPGTAFRFLRHSHGTDTTFAHRVYRSPPLADNYLSSRSARISPQELFVDFGAVYEVFEIYESHKWLSVSFRVGDRIVWTNVRKWDVWWAEPVSGTA
jgi:hypothetical protein